MQLALIRVTTTNFLISRYVEEEEGQEEGQDVIK